MTAQNFGPGLAGFLRIDPDTRTLIMMDQEQYLAQQGNHFFFADFLTLNFEGIATLTFTIPAGIQPGFVFRLGCSETTVIELYEDVMAISGGTAIMPQNNNRNSAITALMTMKLNPAVTLGDDRIARILWSGVTPLGLFSSRNRLIFCEGINYAIKLTSWANENIINYWGSWTE
jgi:hypothetical protein